LTDNDRIVNLKEEPDFVAQYVSLRNLYCDLLLTTPVNVPETKTWLERDDIEIRGIVRGNELIGIAILYLNRKGEIAFFAKHLHSGIGSRLLSVIETTARERGLQEVWAWVLTENTNAQKTFLKNGYRSDGESTKRYMGAEKTGVIFRKQICKGFDKHEGK